MKEQPDRERTRLSFLRWQCLIRQYCVRSLGGRPTDGMRPTVHTEPRGQSLHRITVLINKQDSNAITVQFRHMVRRTPAPADRYDAALRFLSATHYQQPETFADLLTALFSPESQLATRLADAGRCVLDFHQHSQHYRLPCMVTALEVSDPAYQTTFWHNHLFNPAMPGGVVVLGFLPNWQNATGTSSAT